MIAQVNTQSSVHFASNDSTVKRARKLEEMLRTLQLKNNDFAQRIEALEQKELLPGLEDLSAPNKDSIPFYDKSIERVSWLGVGNRLNITGTILDAVAGGGGGSNQLVDADGDSILEFPLDDNLVATLAGAGGQFDININGAVDFRFSANQFNILAGSRAVFGDDANVPPLNITERAAPPATPVAGDIYLDDGTNTGSGNPGWRRYTGAAWEDITAAAGGGAPGGANHDIQFNNAGAFEGENAFTYDDGTNALRLVDGSIELAHTTADPIITIDYENTDNAGDPQVVFSENGTGIFSCGIDTANSNRFVIASNATIGGQVDFVIDTSDNVGIGTAPSARLHVLSTTEQLRLAYDSTHYATFTSFNTHDLRIQTSSTGQIYFIPTTNQTDFFQVYNAAAQIVLNADTSNKRVGICTTAPAATLHAISTTEQLRIGYDTTHYASFTSSSAHDLRIQTTSNGIIYFIPTTDRTGSFQFFNSAAQIILNIDTTNKRVGIGTTTPTAAPLDIVSGIPHIRMEWSGYDRPGFIWGGSGQVALGSNVYYSLSAGNWVNPSYAYYGCVFYTDCGVANSDFYVRLASKAATPTVTTVLRCDAINARLGVGVNVTPARTMHSYVSNATTNSVSYGLRLEHVTSGTAAANCGVGVEYALEDAGGNTANIAATTECAWDVAAHGSEDARLMWSLMVGGAAAAEKMRLDQTGLKIAAGLALDCYTNAGYLKPRRVSQAAQPTPDTAELLLWRDTDDDKTYLVYEDPDVGTRKIELT